MFDARKHPDVPFRSPTNNTFDTPFAESNQTMTTATMTSEFNGPARFTAQAPPQSTPRPVPSSVPPEPAPHNWFPKRSTSFKRDGHFPQRSVSRAHAPPPINTRVAPGWPLAPKSATPDESGRPLWNGASRSPRPRAGTAASYETNKSLLSAGLFRTTSSETQSSDFPGNILHRSQTDPLPPLTPQDVIFPTSAREHRVESPIPSTPRLRTSDSIPDHRKLRYVHPESATFRPRLNIVPSQPALAPGSGIASPRLSPGVSSPVQDRYGAPVRESVKSSYTTTSSRADVSSLERSSTTTSMTSTSDAWNNNAAWHARINQDDISVEDYISLYAEGFEDDPTEDKDRLSPTKVHGSPWPPSGWDSDVPPVPKIDYASAKFHMPSGQALTSKPLPVELPQDPTISVAHPAQSSLQGLDPATQRSPSPPLVLEKELEKSSVQDSKPPRRSFGDAESQYSKRSFEEDEHAPMPTRNSFDDGSEHLDTVRPVFSEPKPDPNADRYGFKKDTRYISLDQYEAWSEQYEDYLQRRRSKWNELMKQHRLSVADPDFFPPRSDKVKRFIRKGIPPEWRGKAWFWYAGGPERLRQNRGLYDHLLYLTRQPGQLGEGDREHIERDLNRTFPDNDKFKRFTMGDMQPQSRPNSVLGELPSQDELPERDMIQSLRQVLQCFAIYQPKIGYCQSLNFLAGKLLLFLRGDEEKAFHLLCILTSEHLPGTHGVALEGANVDISVLMTTLKDQMPAVWAKLEDRPDGPNSPVSPMPGTPRLPTVSLATTSWFMSCFVGTLPVETCCRVWDVLFYEGSKTLFRVALGIFKLGEQEIRSVNDPMEIFSIVQAMPRKMLDANELMEISFGRGMEGRGLLSSGTVKKRRDEKREVYQRTQAVASTLTRSPSTPSIADSPVLSQEDPEELKRPLSRGASLKKLGRLKSITRKKAPPVPKIPI